MAPDVGEEQLQAVARAGNRTGGDLRLFGRVVNRRPDLEPDGLELVRELGNLLVAKVKLERKRL